MKVRIGGLFEKQREIITNILNSSAKFHIINASRQSSKTYTLSRLAVMFAGNNASENVLIAAPTYEQVNIIFENILKIKNIEFLLKEITRSKPSKLKFINGSVISFKSADRPDSLRGGSNKTIILDEFAFFKPDVFSIIRPSTGAKIGSRIIVASTPRGKNNDFYKMSEQGLNGNPNYNYLTMDYSDNPYYDLKEVDDARARLPKAIFRQEYEREFVDDGGDVFENIKEVSNIESFPTYTPTKERYFGGIDWGRAADSTVLTILNSNHDTIYIKSFKGDWIKQISDISEILKLYKPIVYAESNGIGDPLIAQLKQKYSNVFDFTMSNSSKNSIVEQLKMDIFVKNISLPIEKICPELHIELTDFTYSISKTGLIQYHHRPGGHDDYVDSLMIANYSFNNHNLGFKIPQIQKRSNFY